MVRATCAMRGCKSSGIINKELKFHQFPRTENRCKSWVDTCRRSDLFGRNCDSLRNTYVCSLHFEKKMYGKKSLKKTAVPTLLLPPNESISTQTDPVDTVLNDIDLDSPNLKIAHKRNESVGPSSQMADYTVAGETAARNSRWRNGYRCSSCERLIVSKFRYACVQCPNFDLCGACETRGEHAQHYVLRIPPCRPFEEIDGVLRKIRGELSTFASTNIVIKLEVEPQLTEVDPLTTAPPDTGNLDAPRKIKTEELEVITQEHEPSPAGLDERPSWSTDHILPDLPARKPAQVACHERPDTNTSKTQDLPHRPQNYTSMSVLPTKQETPNDFPINLPRKPQSDTSMTDVSIKQEIEIDIPLELDEPSTDNQVVPALKRTGESLKTLRVEAKLEGASPNTTLVSDERSLQEHTRAAKKKKV